MKICSENRKKEFSKIKNIPFKKSNSLSKSQGFNNNNGNSSSSNNNSKIKQIDLNIKNEKAKIQNKNAFQKNYLNINYVNNDLFHQNSNPVESEFDYGNYNSNANPNAFGIISTDIYESKFYFFIKFF